MLWGRRYFWRRCSRDVQVGRLQTVKRNSLVFSRVANDGEKLGGTLVYLEWANIGWLEGTSHCVPTYKDVGTLGQIHADVNLALGMALWRVVPNLLHDGAEAGYIGDRVRDLFNFVEKFTGNAQGGPVHQLRRAAAQVLLDTAAETKENHREGLYPLSGGGCSAETGFELAVESLY